MGNVKWRKNGKKWGKRKMEKRKWEKEKCGEFGEKEIEIKEKLEKKVEEEKTANFLTFPSLSSILSFHSFSCFISISLSFFSVFPPSTSSPFILYLLLSPLLYYSSLDFLLSLLSLFFPIHHFNLVLPLSHFFLSFIPFS